MDRTIVLCGHSLYGSGIESHCTELITPTVLKSLYNGCTLKNVDLLLSVQSSHEYSLVFGGLLDMMMVFNGCSNYSQHLALQELMSD